MAGEERGRKRRKRRRPGWSTEAQEIVDRVFVYASLRAGEAERSMMAEHIGEVQPATMPGRMFRLSDGVVACITVEDELMQGELLTIIDLAAAFPLLDAFQGEDFVRVLRQATTESGELVWAWVYIMADPERAADAEPIEGGDWLAWARTNPD